MNLPTPGSSINPALVKGHLNILEVDMSVMKERIEALQMRCQRECQWVQNITRMLGAHDDPTYYTAALRCYYDAEVRWLKITLLKMEAERNTWEAALKEAERSSLLVGGSPGGLV